MEQAEILSLLHRFYVLEKYEYEHYLAQMRGVEDYKVKKALERFASIELEHMQKIEKMVKKIGGGKNSLNIYTKTMSENLGGLVGTVSGQISVQTGLKNVLKFSIFGEKNAVQHYSDFIKKAESEELKNTLWENMIDEELHQKWMEDMLEQLECQEKWKKSQLGEDIDYE